MSESILKTIRKKVGADPDQDYFDSELISDINAAFAVLTQLGVGPSAGFSVQDETTLWSDFTGNENTGLIEGYVGNKVRLMFDPPTNSFLTEAIQKQIDEFEWRAYMDADSMYHPYSETTCTC